MGTLLRIILLLTAFGLFVNAATRGDIKVIEASENIRYLSQKIVKDYLFLYQYPEQSDVKRKLTRELSLLSDDLRIIAATTKDEDSKDILEFLAYSKDQIVELFDAKANEENAALMLDYSETLLEGADSIAASHRYDFSQEEKMLMLTKKLSYLMERVMKYYMAKHVGFDNTTNKEQMQSAMSEMEESLKAISLYPYKHEMQAEQKELLRAWKSHKRFLEKSQSLFIPKLMFTSLYYMEEVLFKLERYHSKNQ